MRVKKTIALLCIFALLLCPSAFALESPPSLTIDTVNANPGESVTVPIRISGNTGIVGATITITYDKALTLTEVEKGAALSTLTMTKPGNFSANPVNIVWDGTDADTTNGIIATLTFTVPDSSGTYDISASYSAGDIVDGSLSPVTVTITDGGVTCGAGGGGVATGPSLTIDTVNANPGESITVPIRISGNTGIVGATITITYDKALTLTEVEKGTALSTLTLTKPGNLSANPVNLVWDGVDADATNGVIAILTFLTPSEPGVYTISASYADGDIVDNDLKAVSLTITNGKIETEYDTEAVFQLIDSHSLSIQITDAPARYAIAAVYDSSKRMLACQVKSISENACSFSFLNESIDFSSALCKVFLLDEGYAPVCEPLTQRE